MAAPKRYLSRIKFNDLLAEMKAFHDEKLSHLSAEDQRSITGDVFAMFHKLADCQDYLNFEKMNGVQIIQLESQLKDLDEQIETCEEEVEKVQEYLDFFNGNKKAANKIREQKLIPVQEELDDLRAAREEIASQIEALKGTESETVEETEAETVEETEEAVA